MSEAQCNGSYVFGTQCGKCRRCADEMRQIFNTRFFRVNASTRRVEFSDEYDAYHGFVGETLMLRKLLIADYFKMFERKPSNGACGGYCASCGVAANVLTCLAKYGRPPKDLAFIVSTMRTGVCCHCGQERSITEARDYFYPDFGLLTKAENEAKSALSGKNDLVGSPTSPSGNAR